MTWKEASKRHGELINKKYGEGLTVDEEQEAERVKAILEEFCRPYDEAMAKAAKQAVEDTLGKVE